MICTYIENYVHVTYLCVHQIDVNTSIQTCEGSSLALRSIYLLAYGSVEISCPWVPQMYLAARNLIMIEAPLLDTLRSARFPEAPYRASSPKRPQTGGRELVWNCMFFGASQMYLLIALFSENQFLCLL